MNNDNPGHETQGSALRERLEAFCARERAILEGKARGGMQVGYSPSVTPSVLKALEQMLRDTRDASAALSPPPTCDCGSPLTLCSSCAVADWQAAHPECATCCPVQGAVLSPPSGFRCERCGAESDRPGSCVNTVRRPDGALVSCGWALVPAALSPPVSQKAELCGDIFTDGYTDLYCTKPKGHDGAHVATPGPWRPDLVVLGQW